MFLLYLDEFGHAGRWDPQDSKHQHHPLFGLAGLMVSGDRWKELDRGFLRLKQSFFKNELEQLRLSQDLRPERFEPKQLRNRRDQRFALEVLELIRRLEGRVVAEGVQKIVDQESHNERALYTTMAQRVLTSFHKILRQKPQRSRQGLIIMDQRNDHLNEIVLGSCQSYLFSRLRTSGIVETPLLVPSEWYHGVQCADVVGRVVSAIFEWRLCGGIRGRRNRRKDEAVLGSALDDLGYKIGDAWSSLSVRPSPSASDVPS